LTADCKERICTPLPNSLCRFRDAL
jgi:hypothetical protein